MIALLEALPVELLVDHLLPELDALDLQLLSASSLFFYHLIVFDVPSNKRSYRNTIDRNRSTLPMRRPRKEFVVEVARRGHLSLLEWLLNEQRLPIFTVDLTLTALESKNIQILEFIISRKHRRSSFPSKSSVRHTSFRWHLCWSRSERFPLSSSSLERSVLGLFRLSVSWKRYLRSISRSFEGTVV